MYQLHLCSYIIIITECAMSNVYVILMRCFSLGSRPSLYRTTGEGLLEVLLLVCIHISPSGQVSEVYYSVHPHSHVYRVSVSMCIRNCISYIKITIKIVRVAIIPLISDSCAHYSPVHKSTNKCT